MTLPRPRHAEDRAEAATQRAPAAGPPASAPGLQLPGPGHGEAGDRGDGGGRARHHEGQDRGGSTQVELQTKVREDFTITKKAPTRAFSWLKVPTSTFTLKMLCETGT